jgi:hypothetical protein
MNETWRNLHKNQINKFKNKPVMDNGKRFSSKLEHAYKNYLELLKSQGKVLFYLMQVPIDIIGGTKYILDFLVFYENGDVKFIDTKGVETPTFKLKKKQVEALYPFTIEIIKKGDF